MTEKTLKIRIKMHSPTDSPESSPDGIVEPEAHSETSVRSGGSDKLHMGVVAMISGVVMLTLALLFLDLRNRDEPQTMSDLAETTQDLIDKNPAVSNETSEQVALLSELEQQSADSTGDLEAVPAERASDFALHSTATSTMVSSSQDSDAVKSPDAFPPTADAAGEIEDRSPMSQPGEIGATAPSEPPSSVTTDNRSNTPTSGAQRGVDPGSVTRSQTSDDLPNHSELTGTESSGSSPQSKARASQAGTQPARVARAQFTNGIQDREPVDRVEAVVRSDGQTNQQLYYFTDLRNLKGETVTHRWEHQGQQVAEVSFKVGGNRWRVFSRKSLPPDMTGEWQVVVSTSDGQPLETASFVYQEP